MGNLEIKKLKQKIIELSIELQDKIVEHEENIVTDESLFLIINDGDRLSFISAGSMITQLSDFKKVYKKHKYVKIFIDTLHKFCE